MVDQAPEPVATLWICKCKKHGRVIAADGVRSPEVCSKPFARYIVEQGVHWEKIKSTEVPVLFKQIQESPLPEIDKETPPDIQKAVRVWNEAVAMNPDDPLNDKVECVPEFIGQIGKGVKKVLDLVDRIKSAPYN